MSSSAHHSDETGEPPLSPPVIAALVLAAADLLAAPHLERKTTCSP
jgi:hypothetical protein